jgi:quercetin dioxygenase-like cupin family protein
MKVIHGRAAGGVSDQRTSTFSGTVWADPVMEATDGVTINHVFFTPGGRTYWHHHEAGQVLIVTAGRGWVCLDGEAPQEIRQGDTVWIAPGERHWHGAAADSFMAHMAISIGTSRWQEEVHEAHYLAPAL